MQPLLDLFQLRGRDVEGDERERVGEGWGRVVLPGVVGVATDRRRERNIRTLAAHQSLDCD